MRSRILFWDSPHKNGDNLQLIIQYTNSTQDDQIPVKAMEEDMVVMGETDSDSTDAEAMIFREPQDADIESDMWFKEMGELYENGIQVVEPGESVEFLITTDVKREFYNSLYLQSTDEEDPFKMKIEIGSTPI